MHKEPLIIENAFINVLLGFGHPSPTILLQMAGDLGMDKQKVKNALLRGLDSGTWHFDDDFHLALGSLFGQDKK